MNPLGFNANHLQRKLKVENPLHLKQEIDPLQFNQSVNPFVLSRKCNPFTFMEKV